MITFFSYSQGKRLISIFNKLIEIGKINTKVDINSGRYDHRVHSKFIDKLENNPFVYSISPIKDCIMVMYICRLLENSHPELEYLNKSTIQRYSKIVNRIIDNTESMKEIYNILTDKCFNEKEVIDIISSSDLQIILNNSKVGRIVSDFWTGPFETEFFMNNCMAYQQFYRMFIDGKRFLDYKPEAKYRYSISNLYDNQKIKKNQKRKVTIKPRKAHFFHFERWDKSMMTKYVIEAIFILYS